MGFGQCMRLSAMLSKVWSILYKVCIMTERRLQQISDIRDRSRISCLRICMMKTEISLTLGFTNPTGMYVAAMQTILAHIWYHLTMGLLAICIGFCYIFQFYIFSSVYKTLG